MACLVQNMRRGVRYYVSLVRDPVTLKAPMIVGVYQGTDDSTRHVFRLTDGAIALVPTEHIAGCSAARS